MQHTIVVGSGPSAIYFLKQLLDKVYNDNELHHLTIIEKSKTLGFGMPWTSEMAEPYHLSNIAAERIPPLPQTMMEWLCEQNIELLERFSINLHGIDGTEFFPRILVGKYFSGQYYLLVDKLRKLGCNIEELAATEVCDIDLISDSVSVIMASGKSLIGDRVVIASGHLFNGEDRADVGYFDSPWPIFKLLPDKGDYYQFRIGILGASLSAFDVVSALARQHGDFIEVDGRLKYNAFSEADEFKLVMYSAEGWLPQLEYEEKKMTRKIYRYVSYDDLNEIRDNEGFLRLDTYFDHVCRRALIEAANHDGFLDLVKLLEAPENRFEAFIKHLSSKHEYNDPFQGMAEEVAEAIKLQRINKATMWKEAFDDLIYCLNYHIEWMPMEDHVTLKNKVFPFLLNVVAGLPLESARILLALNEAGKLNLVTGEIEVLSNSKTKGMTSVAINKKGETYEESYSMFINCAGQEPIEVESFPFQSLVKQGLVRVARAKFASAPEESGTSEAESFSENNVKYGKISGIDIDSCYRLINSQGVADTRFFDIAFPHTMGARPYSFGLQSCSDAAEIVVSSL